jgi:chromate transporter
MAGVVLDGINAASLSLMAVAPWRLGGAALVYWTTVAMLVIGLILLIRFRINSAWLLLAGALFGLVPSTVPAVNQAESQRPRAHAL